MKGKEIISALNNFECGSEYIKSPRNKKFFIPCVPQKISFDNFDRKNLILPLSLLIGEEITKEASDVVVQHISSDKYVSEI